MRRIQWIGKGFWIVLAGVLLMAWAVNGYAAEPEGEVEHLEDITVKGKAGAPGIEVEPNETVIELDKFPFIGVPDNVLDVLKTQAIVDFRGETDIDPGVDSVFLRGFDAKRFVTAIDGLTVQKTGGRKSSNIVDYALLPTFLIEKIEILPGPHSAIYDSKSIGGVLNLVTKKPTRRDSLQPEIGLNTSYGSYQTHSHSLSFQGAIEAVSYDIAYRKSASDGYLRHNETDMDTIFGRFGLLLPEDGFITLGASYSDIDRQAPVRNPGQKLTDPEEVYSDYDPDYPEVDGSPWDPLQHPTWDGDSVVYRLNFESASPIGRLSGGAYTGKDNRRREYEEYISSTNHSLGTFHTAMNTDWWQEGGKIQDEIRWTDAHVTTLGFDMANLYDDGVDDVKTQRIRKKGGYLQHQWGILPSVDLKLGLRYEDVDIWVTNNGVITGKEDIIRRDWDEVIPKSFATWRMDKLAPWLRDTSLSLGVSKIWRAPDYHGDYNPQGRPAGAWLEPEHGIGYDLVLDRRLWGDVAFKLNYAFYKLEDYIASNSAYARYTPPRGGPTPVDIIGKEYKDYKINLDEVQRHGVDLELGGHLTHDLSFYLTYAWQKFENQGDEPAGETELHQRAEHRISAGLRYDLFENTSLLLDYYYQSEETTEIFEEGNDPDSFADDYFREEEIDAYSVVDFGIRQNLFKNLGFVQEAALSVYVKNVFDEAYHNTSGYPASDRTCGVSLSFRM